ncbi:hypothetical protein Cgig2_011220 [Carnegiea gigantea]|uniref:Aminotransferase-like plant mobile domain-containing protein n=1 Tax=Carnegiea gigantea TaxID=171969 RepID=A0A9Q1KFI2_9CARY|nr:hypothetical protein Cgig2_011220 [Carnegiea gigantea]
MAIFSDESCNKRQYLCIRLDNKDTKETKVQIRKPIIHFSKSKCPEGPPSLSSWSEENLKTGELFLLSSHPSLQKSVPSYQLLHHDILVGQRSWEKLPCQGEFSYTPLYWEWLEDVITRCKDLLVANHLFDALYASLFIYDKCPKIVRAICEYWCPETNSLHTSKGGVSISLLNIYGFLGLPLSGFLYDEVVPPSKELKSGIGRSCTHLFKAYHILRQRFDHKPTIEEWIAFWFRGPVKYYAPTKSDRQSGVPLPNIVSSVTEVHGWNESHVVFDELGVPKGERTETFLTAFLSCWLCLFALPVRDAGCIRPGTFSVASSMEGGQAYCLSSAILVSIYRGLGEICRSAHPGRKGGHIPWHFLYAWVAKYFRTYDFDDNVSTNLRMPKFSGFGRAKIFYLNEAHELVSSGRGFCWNSAIRHRLKAALVDNGQLSRADFAYFASIRSSYVCCCCEDSFVIEHYCPHRSSRQFGFHQDIPADIDFSILSSSKIILRLHQACIRYGTNSRVFFPGQCPSLERKFTRRFQEWWSKMFLTLSDSQSGGSSKRKRASSSDQNIQRNEAPSCSRPKFKIIRSQKPLTSPALETEDNTPQKEIPGVGAALSVARISAVPIQSVPMAPEVSDEGMSNVGGSKLDYGKTVFPPPDGAENIIDILDCDPSPTACMGESGDMNFKEKLAYVPLPSGSHCFPSIEHLSSLGQDFLGDDDEVESTPKVDAPQVLPPPRLSRATPDVSVFNVNAVIREVNKSGARMTSQVILDKVLRTPFERLNCLKGEFDSLYDLIHERGGDATLLKNKVERLIHQACDLKDLQESYSDQMTIEVRESRRVEVGSKLDVASHQLNTEIARYNALKAKLEEVDSRREELLKELQSLDDQKKDLCCQVTASEDSLQEAEQAVIDLKGQIDTLNAIEVIDPATKASLEKTEAYVKESFEDLKTFHWTP